MQQLISYLAIIMSIILFANKVLLLIGKKEGWLIGAFGTVLAIIYLLLIRFPIMATAEVGIFALMLYGFFPKESFSKKVEYSLRALTFFIIIFLSWFTFSGVLTMIEFLASVSVLVGVYLFTHNKEFLGWFLYFIGHVLTAYMAHERHQDFFEHFQIASAVVSLIGMIKN